MTIRERALVIAHKVFGNVPGLLVESLADDIERLCQETNQEAVDDQMQTILDYEDTGE